MIKIIEFHIDFLYIFMYDVYFLGRSIFYRSKKLILRKIHQQT